MHKQKKIIVLGPVYPYKGGIAHHTALLIKSLRKCHNIIPVSFKMQYPRILHKAPQKDFDNKVFETEDVNYIVHTANPFNWNHVSKWISSQNPDLIIIQWWHPYFTPAYCGILKNIKNLPVLFICHNVLPHERFVFDKALTKRTLSYGDFFIVHSKQDSFDLKNIKPRALIKETVLPTFNVFKLRNLTKENSREQLQLSTSENVLLFFGFVRNYKGLLSLIHAMSIICGKSSNFRLLIVGKFSNDKEKYTNEIQRLNIGNNVNIYDSYIPDNEIEKYFVSSDLVVLPYESATQSGIVQIAYGFEKPVVATNVGGLPEVVLNNQTGYIVPPNNPAALAEKILDFFKKGKECEFKKNIQQESYKYEWERMNEIIDEFFC